MNSAAESFRTSLNFQIEFDGEIQVSCSEVTGLDYGYPADEYRPGKSNTRKVWGLSTSNTLTLKRGVIHSQSFLRWILDRLTNTPRGIIIHLLDEHGSRVLSWEVIGALPRGNTAPSTTHEEQYTFEEVTIAFLSIAIQ